MDVTFRPISHWPQPLTKGRKSGKFRASYPETLKLLDRELAHLKARQVVIQLALSANDIRLDGKPRAMAKPDHPGCILSFESRHGSLSYPCDTYDDWRDNLRAIALALEHLRAVDRYGVTKRGEQYKGWAQLPPPKDETGSSIGFATIDEAATFIGFHSKILGPRIRCDRSWFRTGYLEAAKKLHPDVGGNAADFSRLQAAKAMLDRHFGGRE